MTVAETHIENVDERHADDVALAVKHSVDDEDTVKVPLEDGDEENDEDTVEVYEVRTDLLNKLLAEEHGDVDRDTVGEGDVDTLAEFFELRDGVRDMIGVLEVVTVNVCKIDEVTVIDEHAETEGDTDSDFVMKEVCDAQAELEDDPDIEYELEELGSGEKVPSSVREEEIDPDDDEEIEGEPIDESLLLCDWLKVTDGVCDLWVLNDSKGVREGRTVIEFDTVVETVTEADDEE